MTDVSPIAGRVIERFGGVEKFAAFLEIHLVTAYRMTYPLSRRGTGGLIPQRYHAKLLNDSAAHGVAISATDLIDTGERVQCGIGGTPDAPTPAATTEAA